MTGQHKVRGPHRWHPRIKCTGLDASSPQRRTMGVYVRLRGSELELLLAERARALSGGA